MFAKEFELVNEEFVNSKNTYNMKVGGQGGWDYVKSLDLSDYRKIWGAAGGKKGGPLGSRELKSRLSDPQFKTSFSEKVKEGIRKSRFHNRSNFLGKCHTEETKRKIGDTNRKYTGPSTSQFGTCWITNGKENKKIKKEDIDFWIEKGYNKGRIMSLPKIMDP